MGAGRRHRGFTLVELLTVIAITVILFAILMPVGARLREDNRSNLCEVNLQNIHRALKMYQLDEGAYPYLDPMGVPDPLHPDAGSPTPYYDPGPDLVIGTGDDPGVLSPSSWQNRRHYGLLMLLDTGHLTNVATLQCPRDQSPHSPEVGPSESYCISLDETGTPYTVTDAITGLDHAVYKFQPNRRRYDPAEPPFAIDWYRQLAPRTQVDPSDSGYANFQDRYWMPQDSSIVTWCDYHAGTRTRGGERQFVTLFLDGRIQPRPESEFTAFDPALSTAENLDNAWRNVLPEEGQ